jgi:hypothetical protein
MPPKAIPPPKRPVKFNVPGSPLPTKVKRPKS